MSSGQSRIYVVGDRETGIMFVTTNPLRAVPVERAEIEGFAKRNNMSFDEAFGEFTAASAKMILENDRGETMPAVPEVPEAIGRQVARGVTISDADFCFIADVDVDGINDKRSIYAPIHRALDRFDRGVRAAVAADRN